MYTPKQIGEILSSQQQKKLDDERPKKATVVATGSGLTNRVTTGQIRAELSNGTTIWVDAGGNLAELTAGDIIYVERIGVGKRSEWRMVDWFSDSVGNRVPAGRADVFTTKVSEIWAADGDPIALDTDNSGNMEVFTSLDMGGTQLVLDADGDTSITADTDDQIDIEVAGVDIGYLNGAGLVMIASRDVYPDGDDAPLFDRFVNWGVVPGEHFRNFGDTLSWTGWASYTGYVTPASLTYTASLYTIGHDAGGLAFRYITVTPDAEEKEIMARVAITYSADIGIMIDDGVDTEDGEGADNFIRWYVTNGTSATRAPYLEYEYREGGGAVSTISYTSYYLMPQTFYCLWIATKNTEWTSWNPRIMIRGEADVSNEFSTFFSSLPATQAWTPARVGIYYRNLATSVNDRGVVDWFHHTF